MTCATSFATTPTVTLGQPAAGQPRPDTRAPSAPCEPAGSTSHGPKTAGVANTIQSRAARLRHSNRVQMQRYLDRHMTLGRCSEADE